MYVHICSCRLRYCDVYKKYTRAYITLHIMDRIVIHWECIKVKKIRGLYFYSCIKMQE